MFSAVALGYMRLYVCLWLLPEPVDHRLLEVTIRKADGIAWLHEQVEAVQGFCRNEWSIDDSNLREFT